MSVSSADIAWMRTKQGSHFRDTGQLGTKILGTAGGLPNDGLAIHAAIDLSASTQDITTALTNPATPASLSVRGNKAGCSGNVVITGTDSSDVAQSETFALSGMKNIEGTKAFKTITKIAVPVQSATGQQVSVFATWTWATAISCGVEFSPADESGTGEVPLTPTVLRVPVTTSIRPRDIFRVTAIGGTTLSTPVYMRIIGEQNRGLSAYISRAEVMTGPLP